MTSAPQPGPLPALVPAPLWGHSAARLLPTARWREVRAVALEAAGWRCAHCRRLQRRGLVCHEEWRYGEPLAADAPARAQLVALRAQCSRCDAAVHYGLATVRGVDAAAAARAQICKVTGLSPDDVALLCQAAFEENARRGRHRWWQVTVAEALVIRYPDLRVVEGIVWSVDLRYPPARVLHAVVCPHGPLVVI